MASRGCCWCSWCLRRVQRWRRTGPIPPRSFHPASGTMRPSSSTLERPDGTARTPRGTSRCSDGTFRVSRGTLHRGEWTFHRRDATFRRAEGTFRRRDGTFRPADRTFHSGDRTFHPAHETFRSGDETSRRDDATLHPADETSRPGDETFRRDDGSFRCGNETLRWNEETFRRDDESFRSSGARGLPGAASVGSKHRASAWTCAPFRNRPRSRPDPRGIALVRSERGIPDDVCVEGTAAALVHDIGSALLPEAISGVPEPLLDEEGKRMYRYHPLLGARALLLSGAPGMWVEVALQHHRGVDLHGYPALDTDRTARDRAHGRAGELRRAEAHAPRGRARRAAASRGTALLGACRCGARFGVFPPGTAVELSTGETAVVTRVNAGEPCDRGCACSSGRTPGSGSTCESSTRWSDGTGARLSAAWLRPSRWWRVRRGGS